MHTFTLLICIVCIILIVYFLKIIFREVVIYQHLQKLPGPSRNGLLSGNILALHDTPENVFKVVRKWGIQYYPAYKNYAAHIIVANIANPYDFESILKNIKHIEKSFTYSLVHRWLGTGLLTSTGKKWLTRRKILTPSFHFNILQGFITIFNEETEKFVVVLKKECQKSSIINVTPYISECTLKTIGETAMGVNFDSITRKSVVYKKAIHEIGQIVIYRLFRPWLLSEFIYFFHSNHCKEVKLVKVLHQFTTEVIKKREEDFTPVILPDDKDFCYSKRKRLAMLDLLLTAKKVEGIIDDDGIREEVDTFMFEGHDTTAVAIQFALMLIACNRDVQNRIVNEMEEVLGSSTHRNPSYSDLLEMQYLERCIKESLRLYPSVPFIARVLGEDLVSHSGHLLKAGSSMNMHIYDVHHNPDLYPDPEKFDPDRFLPENCKNRHHFAYVPFSAGSRNCIGQKFAMLELKAVLCGVLSEFVLVPVDTPSTIELITDIVLRTKSGIRIKFLPRR